MRLAVIAATIAAAAFVVAACSQQEAGWTYAPPPSEAPRSAAPSAAPGSQTPSAAPSVAPTPAPSAAPTAPASAPASAGASPGANVIVVTATNIAFEEAQLDVPADVPFTLELVNNDASVPHDVAIKDEAGGTVYQTDTFPGVETRSFEAPALPAGQYQFQCTIHPNMIIDVTAQ